MVFNALDFVRESNRIEGIHREPTPAEMEEFFRFMALDKVSVTELCRFVSVYQPNAVIRSRVMLNVSVGGYYAPPGGPKITKELKGILGLAPRLGAYQTHVQYELLHPFTDGNGRSGRMLWMYMMREAPLGFLHTFYYQSLSEAR